MALSTGNKYFVVFGVAECIYAVMLSVPECLSIVILSLAECLSPAVDLC